MSKLRTTLLALAATASVFAASSASAASFEVWNGVGWSNNGTVLLSGPISINNLPCNADFTVAVVAGVANVVAVRFAGTVSACGAVSAQHLPWLLSAPIPYSGANPPFSGAPILTPVLSSVQISGVRLLVPGSYCPSATGTGTIASVLDTSYQGGSLPPANNRLVFKTTLAACTFQTRTTTPPYSLVTLTPMRVVP